MLRTRTVTAIALLLAVAACSDGVGPPKELGELDVRPVLGSAMGEPKDGTSLNALRQAPWAPPLATYAHSFWAVKGQETEVKVRYVDGDDDDDGDRFLTFEVPAYGLQTRPDGTWIAYGDSVLITLTIDPVLFHVEFQPSGLQFSQQHPAELKLWYKNADPDLNGDGQVDHVDEAIRQNLLGVWLGSDGGSTWVEIASEHDLWIRRFETHLFHFSGVVTSY